MTRQEQLSCLTDRPCAVCKYHTDNGCSQWKCVFEEQPCGDAISRGAVLDILDDMVKDYVKENDFDKAHGVAWVKVQKLPSVSTEKTGEWIETEVMQSGYKETWIKCNNCGYDTALLIPKKYCPNCGAKMEVEE